MPGWHNFFFLKTSLPSNWGKKERKKKKIKQNTTPPKTKHQTTTPKLFSTNQSKGV